MKISYNWLKQYIPVDLPPDEVAEILTNIGLEVASVEPFQSIPGGLEGLIVGEVVSVEPHPNADKLKVTLTNIGNDQTLRIVCGAPNVENGQKVVVAPVGTTLFIGKEEIKIKKTKIRGIESEGMICAEDEVGLGNSHEGIIVLDTKYQTGVPLKEYFEVEQDTVFEIELTPNRIDAASHLGVARELAAYLYEKNHIKMSIPEVDPFVPDKQEKKIDVIVENKQACPRYSGLTVSHVNIKESPQWLKNRLKAIGLTPINNVVDITNFVLYETGQPLHAFDADEITGEKIIVKTLKEGTKFITLDETERTLSSHDLMICNADEGMCIAGVFGGMKSGIKDTTKTLFLESAHFDPVYIRKTSKRHGLHTDASFRFERGADTNNTIYALKRAALLMKEIAGGTISSCISDFYPDPVKECTIEIYYSNINRLIGNPLNPDVVKTILKALGMTIVAEKVTGLLVDVPTYRVDVKREADVIEEILRIYGFNRVSISTDVKSCISYNPKPDKEQLQNIISDFLCGNGFNEIMCNSITAEQNHLDKDQIVKIFNPLSSDLNCMRQSLLFGGLQSIEYNKNRKNSDLRLFEFGAVYFLKNKNKPGEANSYQEEQHLGIFLTGQKYQRTWDIHKEPVDFFRLKTFVDNIAERIGLTLEVITTDDHDERIFSTGLCYVYNNHRIADFGLVKPELTASFDIEQEVYFANIRWSALISSFDKHHITFREIPRFPQVQRDMALLLDKQVSFAEIKNIAFRTEKNLLRKVSLFDIYEGKELGENKKSYAIHLVLQDEQRTLTDQQIERIMNNLTHAFKSHLKAEIR